MTCMITPKLRILNITVLSVLFEIFKFHSFSVCQCRVEIITIKCCLPFKGNTVEALVSDHLGNSKKWS